MTTQQKVKWRMKGDAIGACSCDWGCPCNFDAAPTKGWCEGGYSFHINEGHYGETELDGLTIGFFAHAPAAMHLGDVTGYVIIDERASARQREALTLILGGQAGGPFAALAGLLSKVIGPDFAPAEWTFDGPRSRARFGNLAETSLEMIKNPVTGAESGFTLQMTAGLLTDRAELMKSSVFRINHPELTYDHSGQYGETFQFSYSGEG